MCKTVPFQIFNSNANKNSFQLVRTAFPSFVFFSFFPPFFSQKTRVFFQGARGSIIGFTARAFQTDAIRLAIFFKELLKNISEIYLQGRLTAKAQTVCLEPGPLRFISKSPLPPPLPESLGALIRARFMSYLTFSIKLLTFFWLDISLYFSQTLLRNAKLARGCQNYRKLCF